MNAKPRVYFTKTVSPESLIRMYEVLQRPLPGRVAVKVHTGEAGNRNFIRPAFLKPLVDAVQGTIVECNAAYEGRRNTTQAHWETIRAHGWTDIAAVDILDEDGDIELPIPGGRRIRANSVGDHIARYESLLVVSHFKGHQMGGFGGALKNISIGIASARGKANIHGAGVPEDIWSAEQDAFLESMADASWSIVERFQGKAAFLNLMCNLSIDCDCDPHAAPPAMADIGILSSLDPVALDRACLDLVYASDDPGRDALIARIEGKHGAHTVECAEALGAGQQAYELVEVDG